MHVAAGSRQTCLEPNPDLIHFAGQEAGRCEIVRGLAPVFLGISSSNWVAGRARGLGRTMGEDDF
jgi:hypothetical protein